MKTYIIFFIFFLIFTNQSFAEYAQRNDYSYINTKQDIEIVVNSDGSFTEDNKVVYEITKSTAIKLFSMFSMQYNTGEGNFKVIDAKVENDGVFTKVNKKNIVDKAIANKNTNGFDNLQQVSIAFPQLKVGTRIHLHVKENTPRPIVPAHFSRNIKFGNTEYEENTTLKIKSKLKLNFKINDPYKVVSKEESSITDDYFNYTIKNKRSFSNDIVKEHGFLPKEKITYIEVSSDTDWSRYTKHFSENYPNKFDQVIPFFKEIIRKASKEKDLETQVNMLNKFILNNFTYSGDWRTYKGSYIPRKLSEIVDTRYGDCKDFSYLLIYLLKQMKKDAHFAIVNRSPLGRINTNYSTLPISTNFNHSIVNLKDGENEYWIDPTNPNAYGLKIREDILGQFALVIDNKEKMLQEVKTNFDQTSYFMNKALANLKSNKTAKYSGNLIIKNTTALMLTGIEEKQGRAKTENIFKRIISNKNDILNFNAKRLNLTSKIYKDIDIDYTYTDKGIGQKFNDLNYITIQTPPVFKLRSANESDEGDLYIGQKNKYTSDLTLKNIVGHETSPTSCDIKSDWIDFKRDIYLQDSTIRITQTINVKKEIVKIKEANEATYITLVNLIQECISNNKLFYKFGTGIHKFKRDVFAQFEFSDPKDIPKLRYKLAKKIFSTIGGRKLSNYDLNDAKKLLVKNTEEHPEDILSHFLLARVIKSQGYYGGNQYNKNSQHERNNIIQNIYLSNRDHFYIKLHFLRHNPDSPQAAQLYSHLKKNIALESRFTYESLLLAAHKLGLKNDVYKYIDKLKSMNAKMELVKYYMTMAGDAADKKDYKTCIKGYEEASKLNPDFAWPLGNSADCYSALNRNKEAIEKLEQALNILDYGMARTLLIQLYNSEALKLIPKKKYILAKKYIEKALNLSPDLATHLVYAFLSKKLEDKVELKRQLSFAKELAANPDEKLRVAHYFRDFIYKDEEVKYIRYTREILGLISNGASSKISNISVSAIRQIQEKKWNKKNAFLIYENSKKILATKMEEAERIIDPLKSDNTFGELFLHLGYIEYSMFSLTRDFTHFRQMESYISQSAELNSDSRIGKELTMKIAYFNRENGRSPSSFSWKIKKMAHNLSMKYFETPLFSIDE